MTVLAHSLEVASRLQRMKSEFQQSLAVLMI